MSKNIDRKSVRNLYIIMNILVFFVAQTIINKQVNKYFLFCIIVSFPLYYILNIFNFENRVYRIKDLVSTIISNLLLMFFFNLTIFYQITEGIIFFSIIILYQIIAKYIIYLNISRKYRVLIIGENEYKQEIIEEIKKQKIYKIVADTKNKDEIKKILEQKHISIVVDFDSTYLDDKEMASLFLKYKLYNIKFYSYITFYEILFKRLSIKVLSDKYFIIETGFSAYQDSIRKNLKRLFDLVFAFIILIPSIPVMIISAIIVKLESKGPVIYSQERIGENNKVFKIYKFRSMTTDSEKDGPKWAKENDNRVTKFGNIMRKTRIDELPQLYNVIRGQMSFVGPRPERQYFINTLEKEIPYYNVRHIVKPGLTGWAQVKYPYGASVEDAYRKLQYDLYYIKHYSLGLDILIILDTIKIVIFGKGR